MPTAEKVARVEQLTTAMAEAKAIYLADFTGVNVTSITELRRKLTEASTDYQVVKNRLAKLAADASGHHVLTDFLTGPTAMAFAKDDPVVPAKILSDFISAGGKLSIKSGLVDGHVLTSEQIQELAKLPSREQLLGKVAGGIQAPLYGFVAVLTGMLRNLVGVLSAIEEKQKEGAPAPVEGGAPADPSGTEGD